MATTGVRDPFADLFAPERPTAAPQSPRRAPVPQRRHVSVGRRLLGVLVLLVMTAISTPVHVFAVFLVFIEIESPGDPQSAALLIGGAGLGSFLMLLLTASLTQAVGGFPGRWRARVTFAVLSALLAMAVAVLGVVAVFRS